MTTSQNTSFENLQTENSSLKNDIKLLQEQVEWFKRNIFGKRSEKIVADNESQMMIDGFGNLQEVEEETKEPKSLRKRRKPKRNGQDKVTLPQDIPTDTIVIDIPDEEKICSKTGKPLVKIGEEVTNKLAHKPGSYYIKKIIRPKYASQNSPENGISIASLPDSLLTRCLADESLLADILVKKFCDHMPLYRQNEILSREGIYISRQLLSKWVIRVGMALRPLYDAMTDKVLQGNNIFVDETPVKMLSPGRGKTKETYVWALVGGKSKDPPYRIYKFFPNRKHCNAKKLIKEFRGILHSDKYGAYETLANEKIITWCPCYSHIRRKFFEAQSGDIEFRDWMLMKIRHLFLYERIAWTRGPEERLKIRQEKEVPIIDEMIKAVKTKLQDGNILPKSNFYKALGYFNGLIPYLKNYTKDPYSRLDNNVAERAVRPLAIGRKNFLFFGNENGGEAASIIYSLVQTCRELGVNPRDYLEDVMRRMMDHPANKISELLPDQWAIAKGISLRNNP